MLVLTLLPAVITRENADTEWPQLCDRIVQQNSHFDRPDVDRLIPLLRRMLVLDSASRPSVEEVLADPWLAEGLSVIVDGNAEVRQRSMSGVHQRLSPVMLLPFEVIALSCLESCAQHFLRLVLVTS